MAASSNAVTYNTPCAACKFLRRKCVPDCIFAPYFPPEEPQKFANVHKIFGASNVTKLLNELLPHQREDAVNSLAYEAEARVRDPVYGCVGAISFLQMQVERLQDELDAANAELIRYASGSNHRYHHHQNLSNAALPVPIHTSTSHHTTHQAPRQMRPNELMSRGGIIYYPTPSNFWNDNNASGRGGAGGI
ncbi:Protein LATERAL ORGAN BOUNDARIES [Heracleum sosnowskyi]|uniref:Protein LATERAL ORGAN BOUNDARIES n=1 Tax=Heracleum sosnowskyi TaxID=360622 RepID=A0AAD8H4V3_9APIA|nr:Protein LATERAL ORGAN BOUNDARIES [Heracleum sosnowskyi]